MIQMHDFIGPIPLIGLNQFKNLNLQIIIYIAKFIDPVNQSFQLVNQWHIIWVISYDSRI